MKSILAALCALSLAACGDDDGAIDAGGDGATLDAPTADAPMSDAPVSDAPVSDAPMSDAPMSDAPMSDAPVTDAGVDAAIDGGADAGTDAGTDAGFDAGFDAGVDAGDPCTPNPCFMDAACTNVGGAAMCPACPAGYSGDGMTCLDTDGCAGDPCFTGVGCTDVPAPGTGFTCGDCPAGTSGDGETCTSFADLVINEVDYDQVGADGDEFVEILNAGSTPVALSGLMLYLVNGNTNTDYDVYDLGTLGTLAAGARIVVGSATVLATLPVGTATIALGGSIQNGAPDGVAIVRDATSERVDAFSYEGEITAAMLGGLGPFDLVEGTASTEADSNTRTGALIRSPDGSDTDDASSDWAFTTLATPGAANLFCPPADGMSAGRALVFSAVDTLDDAVVLTNTTGADVDITGWWFCERPAYIMVPAGTTIPANGSVTFFLTSSGVDTASEVYLNDARFDLDPAGDEIAIYNTNSFGSAAAIEAFVAFGAPPIAPTRQPFAVTAGLWTTGDFVPLAAGNDAMIAVGVVSSSTNWIDVNAACVP